MSSPIFPTLPGLGWGCMRTAKWGTQSAEAASGIEYRIQTWPYPRWEWDLVFNYLQSDATLKQLQALGALFNACAGGTLSFLFMDPQDNQTAGEYIATGNGSKTTFQLQRRWSSVDNSLEFDEPIWAVDTRISSPVIYVNGVVSGTASVNAETGLVTFSSPPFAGATITADFHYFFRARFADDSLELTDLFQNVWEVQKLRLVQARQ